MGVCEYVSFIARNGQNIFPYSFLTPEEAREEAGLNPSDILENIDGHDSYTNEDDLPWGAMIVTLPGDMKKRDIFKMKLTDFAKYPAKFSEYSWDHWDFLNPKTGDSPNPEFPNYRDILMEKNYKNRISYAVWKSPDLPKEEGRDWFVNFEYREYIAFVLGQVKPEDIKYEQYFEILTERVDIEEMFPTFNKKEMYDYIVLNQK